MNASHQTVSVSYQKRERAPYWRRASAFWLQEARRGPLELRSAHVALARSALHQYLRLKRMTVIR